MRIPKPEMFQGRHSIQVRTGRLSDTQWAGVWAFRCVESDEVLAYFAEALDWYAIVPNPWSDRLAGASGADQYLAPFFCVEGVPLVRSHARLRDGLVAPARVPVNLKPIVRASVQARRVSKAKATAKVA